MTAGSHPDPRRQVPRTDAVLGDPRLDGAVGRLGRTLVREAVTAAQDRVRAIDTSGQGHGAGTTLTGAVRRSAMFGFPRIWHAMSPTAPHPNCGNPRHLIGM